MWDGTAAVRAAALSETGTGLRAGGSVFRSLAGSNRDSYEYDMGTYVSGVVKGCETSTSWDSKCSPRAKI